MRFEYLILLIVAFNVVTALVQRRAKKKRAEAAARAARTETAPRPAADDPALEDGPEPREMPSLGRDILDQLARDLGLRLPKRAPSEPWEERPEPVIAAERPEPRPAPERIEARPVEKPVTEKPYATPRAAEVAAARSRGAAPRPEASGESRKGLANKESPSVRKIPASTPVPRVNLREPGRLREAFILQEVLGRPVSRRR